MSEVGEAVDLLEPINGRTTINSVVRTKSLLKLKSALDEHWRLGQQVSLTRIGPRLFLLGSESVAPDTYVYDSGFTASGQKAANREIELADKSGGKERSRRLLVGTSVMVALLAAGLFFAFAKPTDFFGATPVNGTGIGQSREPVSSSTAKASSNIQAPSKPSCGLVVMGLQPQTVASRPESGGTARLIEDIVLGGERQQELEFICGATRTFYQVRFSLVQGTWKAKSATPMGSHS